MIRIVPKANSYFKNYDKTFKNNKIDKTETEACASSETPYQESQESPESPESPLYWKDELVIALKYLKMGKAQFAPSTTNSDVDCFLTKHKHLLSD